MPKLEMSLKAYSAQPSLLPQWAAWLLNFEIHKPLTGKVLQQQQKQQQQRRRRQPYNSVSADRQPADCLL